MSEMSGSIMDSMCSITPPSSQDEFDVEMLNDFGFDSPPLILPHELEDGVSVWQPRDPVCLRCQGTVLPRRGAMLYHHVDFHHKGLLKSGVFDRLILQPSPSNFGSTVELFDYSFHSLVLGDRMEKLFRFSRQTMSEIQNSCDEDRQSIMRKREDIVSFLEYVNKFLQRCMSEDENERRRFLRSLLPRLHLLLVHCGNISEKKYSLDKLSDVHHLFHHHLELTWYLLVVFHTLSTFTHAAEVPVDVKLCGGTVGCDGDRSAFDQLMALLMVNLTSLAVPLFEKVSPHEWQHTSPFPCVCVMEVWMLLIHLSNHRKDKYGTESFWVQLYQIFQNIGDTSTGDPDVEEEFDSDVFPLRVSPGPSRPPAFCLWLTSHLAQLFSFQHNGDITTPDPRQSGFFTIQMTMDNIMKAPVSEETLRACLRCCLSVSHLWPPSSQLIALLWEHFAKRLSERFPLNAASLDGLAAINKSSTSLLEQCRQWLNKEDSWREQDTSFHLLMNVDFACVMNVDCDCYRREQDTSFHLFLRLLARLLGHSGAPSEWRQIKGRFLCKFHQRRMQELGERGLHNVTCLFLTVALCVDTEDTARRLSGLYDFVNPAQVALRSQVWCGALALAQLLRAQGKSFAFLAEKLATSFNSMAKQLSSSSKGQKQELSPLVSLYIDGVRDLVEQSRIEGAEHLFIGEGVGGVLRCCSDSPLRHALAALDTIVMRLRSLVSLQKQVRPGVRESCVASHVAFAERLWLHVFPFVCDHAVTLTPPLSLADLAVSFTQLALDFAAPPGVCEGGCSGVVRRFLVPDATHPGTACHFLNQLLADPGLRASTVDLDLPQASSSSSSVVSSPAAASPSSGGRVKVGGPLSQTEVVKVWWRCVLLMAPASKSLAELTQHMVTLPDVQRLVPDRDPQGPLGWRPLLRDIGRCFHNAQSLLERERVRGQAMPYFSDSATAVSALIRSPQTSPDTAVHVYRALGWLVRHCAPLLYLQSKRCPLPEVMSLVLPAAVFHTDRPLPSGLLAALRETLHMFLEGLGQLDYTRDAYVQRQVGNLLTQYLPRFPLNLVDVYSHPVLSLLGRLPHEKTLTDSHFNSFVAELVVENLRKNSSSINSEVIKVLKSRHCR